MYTYSTHSHFRDEQVGFLSLLCIIILTIFSLFLAKRGKELGTGRDGERLVSNLVCPGASDAAHAVMGQSDTRVGWLRTVLLAVR